MFDTSNLRVTKILIHPIKSCRGTSLQEARYTLEGFENDRKWCIIGADNHVVVTARQVSKLVLVHPHVITDPLAPEGGCLQVTFPEDSGCETFSVPLNPSENTFRKWESVDLELWGKKDVQGYICETTGGRSPSMILSEYIGCPVHLVVKGPRVRHCQPTASFPKLDAPSYFQDAYPLLLVSEESVGAVQERMRDMVGTQGISDKWAEEELKIERFRPNIVFKGAGAPFVEDVVTELSISSDKEAVDGTTGVIHLVSKCTRCLVRIYFASDIDFDLSVTCGRCQRLSQLPNVDPATGVRDEAVPYKVIMKFRRGLDPTRASAPCVGCNGVPAGEGVVKVGDWSQPMISIFVLVPQRIHPSILLLLLLLLPFHSDPSSLRGSSTTPLPRMAIAKWISFTHPASVVSDTLLPKPIPIPCTADGKQFGLENVRIPFHLHSNLPLIKPSRSLAILGPSPFLPTATFAHVPLFHLSSYANSVLQALYFCSPFRELVIQYTDPYASLQNVLSSHFAPIHPPTSPVTTARRKPDRKSTQDPPPPTSVPHPPTPPVPSAPRTLFSALRALYIHISQNPVDKGTIAPRAFIEKLRELNEGFRNTMHQDAHEFLNYLLNRIVEEIEEEKKRRLASGDDLPHSMNSSSTASHPPIMTASASTSSTPSPGATFIHQIFEGTLTSETRCLTCENISSRDESFLDLSIDIEQNSSVTACLRQFSASEMLCQKEKFFCDACCDLQEAERRMKIKRLPNVLALHLKRFKYQEDVQKYIKLTYRVAFPFELRLFNTVDDISNPDRLYELFAIVVHIGNGPNHGHYVSIIRTMGTWLIFDDETVDSIKECDIPKYFGDSNSGSAYVLYYQAVDVDLSALGLRPPSPEPVMQPVPPSDPQRDWQLTDSDSPVLAAQSIPPLPPGLTDDLPGSTPVPEAIPRPTTPPTSIQSPLEPSRKSPRKVSSQFLKGALGRSSTVGHGPNDPVLRLDEKFSSKPSLTPITIFPKEDLKPLEGHSVGAVNGRERDSDKSMISWLRRRSFKNVKSRPSLEVNADVPSLPQAVLAAPGSPVRNQSSSSSNSSKDSRRLLDSPTPGHSFPRGSPFPNGKPPPLSWVADPLSCETDSKQSSASASACTPPISPPFDRHSQPRPLPPIPASPQTPIVETLFSSYSSTSVDHSHASRRYATPSTKDFIPSSPKPSGRPATSAGPSTNTHPPPISAPPSSYLRVPSPKIAASTSDSNDDTAIERPNSAHASYGVMLSPPSAYNLPPLSPVPVSEPVSVTSTTRKTATRKLSFSTPRLGFGRRDKDKH
ncbi:hypothetical protein J3R82DRAFT_293 [Butyriboletus roseoflavus]|nr:hypothetical protein J3R82DRAFT_293 [Butyriboletus roseoflavus]